MADSPRSQPKYCKAVHSFKGTNNDELCFEKGDIITITQSIEGGWWEGTLNGMTGWFPSNYVKEVKSEVSNMIGPTPTAKGTEISVHKPRESMQFYHNVVLQNVIETEKAHVNEMSSVLQTYIIPLHTSGVLSPPEYAELTGNFEELVTFHQKFLSDLEDCSKLPPAQRRVGGIFMNHAPSSKDLYMTYCSNHPRAVVILQKKKDELCKFMESVGAPSPGAMTLTTNLSKPFTRLDKYPSLLKELERHIEESHVDRGDTQRAIFVYREISNSCTEIRKFKEMEYEIINNEISGWEGEDIAKLGEVQHLSQVKMHTHTGEKFDRIFVLFPGVLVMLSVSENLSDYHYEGKIPLSGINLTKCEDTDDSINNAFEISGTMIEKITITCGTRSELNSWLDVLKQQISPTHSGRSSKPLSLQISTSQPHISSVVSQAKTAKVTNSPPVQQKMSKTWSMSCLRPAPPLRPPLLYDPLRSPRTGRKSSQRRKPDDPKTLDEDALILKVIETYCTSAKTRHTVNSSILMSPHVLIAEEEKIIIDDGGDPQEKSLVDTVYSLKDQIKEIEVEQKRMKKDLEDEKRARKKLENKIRKSLRSLAETSWEENMT